jgi:hypothetical protein
MNDGGFSETAQIHVGVRPHLVVSGDFDGDGGIDLAVANDGSNTVTILKNQVVTSVAANGEPQPEAFFLSQNYPNPFNPATSIPYFLPKAARVELIIYNLLGQETRTLVSVFQDRGSKAVTWDGKNDRGETVPSGIYVYRLRGGNFSQTRRMVFLK